MCTVTYLPISGGFVLTHNRDEAPSRSVRQLTRLQSPSGELLFPRDALAGGSWIAVSASGRAACILNGAFERHLRQPPYRRSRGWVLLDSFDWESDEAFAREYDLTGTEPFTFLGFSAGRVLELRWDGARKHLRLPSSGEAHFWCSATLYPADMRERRERIFRDWLAAVAAPPTAESLLDLHRTGSVGDPANDFVMNREDRVRTVSITQLAKRADACEIAYFDLSSQEAERLRLPIREMLPG